MLDEIETNNLAETICELKIRTAAMRFRPLWARDSCVLASFFEPIGPSVSAALKSTKG
ncbi:msl9634 (plasmid) [Mesorhizobium japonicum MAFF 303099]|uniref:Msl9634 protein n=1 Tax=Mesorhizobium japonicum (strain LMG 29417 / CECT 9101 / MAFF 303099) TaxID=266835 RepID=Q98P31_RHILO|nr:msl9634 [Mesorhizobium japonicum MAFF 303099]